MNKVILIGNIGNDAELKHLENGTPVAKASIATTENYKSKDKGWQTKTEWHDLIFWRHLADKAKAKIKKGNKVSLIGKLRHRKWTDGEGKRRKTTEIVVDSFTVEVDKYKTELRLTDMEI